MKMLSAVGRTIATPRARLGRALQLREFGIRFSWIAMLTVFYLQFKKGLSVNLAVIVPVVAVIVL